MIENLDGNAIVYCQSAFLKTNGKTAHGLVRRSGRYRMLSVIDGSCAGGDAGLLLDGVPAGIPVVPDLDAALAHAREVRVRPTHLVVGFTPDGGRLPAGARADILEAICAGLDIDSGLHDLLSEDPEIAAAAALRDVCIRDIRKPPERGELRFFSGAIERVGSLKVAVLGTDSAVGKRTTAWLLVDGLRALGWSAELIGTGQTAWLQGARYGIVLDSLVNDFVVGEIEHAVCRAWEEKRPEVIVIEGQGSLMNPAYPGGFEILAAARPDVVVLQHAPARREYDGFPGYPLHPLEKQIRAIEMISDARVVAITINHEGLRRDEIDSAYGAIWEAVGLPAFDVLRDGPGGLVSELAVHLGRRPGQQEELVEIHNDWDIR